MAFTAEGNLLPILKSITCWLVWLQFICINNFQLVCWVGKVIIFLVCYLIYSVVLYNLFPLQLDSVARELQNVCNVLRIFPIRISTVLEHVLCLGFYATKTSLVHWYTVTRVILCMNIIILYPLYSVVYYDYFNINIL